jgi:hypothetical protein
VRRARSFWPIPPPRRWRRSRHGSAGPCRRIQFIAHRCSLRWPNDPARQPGPAGERELRKTGMRPRSACLFMFAPEQRSGVSPTGESRGGLSARWGPTSCCRLAPPRRAQALVTS